MIRGDRFNRPIPMTQNLRQADEEVYSILTVIRTEVVQHAVRLNFTKYRYEAKSAQQPISLQRHELLFGILKLANTFVQRLIVNSDGNYIRTIFGQKDDMQCMALQ